MSLLLIYIFRQSSNGRASKVFSSQITDHRANGFFRFPVIQVWSSAVNFDVPAPTYWIQILLLFSSIWKFHEALVLENPNAFKNGWVKSYRPYSGKTYSRKWQCDRIKAILSDPRALIQSPLKSMERLSLLSLGVDQDQSGVAKNPTNWTKKTPKTNKQTNLWK